MAKAKAKTAGRHKSKKVKAKTAAAAKTKTKEPEETMDRKALKSVVAQLQGMGSEIKVLKSDTDDVLQKKVNEALHQLPSAEVQRQLESIDPTKLVTVLKRGCVGLFIDLSDVSCIRCRDNQHCAEQFIKNVTGSGLASLARAMPGDDGRDDLRTLEPAESRKTTAAAARYEESRAVFIGDVKNPNPKGDDYHDTIQAVLDEMPETLGQLREIVDRDFEIEHDSEFMKWVTGLRKEGVVKLDVDLTESDKAQLRAVGYDIA